MELGLRSTSHAGLPLVPTLRRDQLLRLADAVRGSCAADGTVEATDQRRQKERDESAVGRCASGVSEPRALLCDDAAGDDVMGGAFEEASDAVQSVYAEILAGMYCAGGSGCSAYRGSTIGREGECVERWRSIWILNAG